MAKCYRPIVVWGAAVSKMTQLTVGSDDAAGGRLAARHLLAQRRQRRAFFGNPAVPEFAARYDRLRAAAAETGACEPVMLPVHLTSEAAFAEIQRFPRSTHPPDGILAVSNVIAMSTLRALAEHGKRVPHDVGVIGYNDINLVSIGPAAAQSSLSDQWVWHGRVCPS